LIRFDVSTEKHPGIFGLIDDADDCLVFDGGPRWRATRRGKRETDVYIARTTRGKGIDVTLHRYLMGVKDPKIVVDHKNGNPLDCRRINMRLATIKQNVRNAKPKTGRGLPKGVVKWGPRFRAKITVDRKCIHLGLFDTAASAGDAYDAAAIKYFGRFARINKEI
jgi:hypothetical protein